MYHSVKREFFFLASPIETLKSEQFSVECESDRNLKPDSTIRERRNNGSETDFWACESDLSLNKRFRRDTEVGKAKMEGQILDQRISMEGTILSLSPHIGRDHPILLQSQRLSQCMEILLWFWFWVKMTSFIDPTLNAIDALLPGHQQSKSIIYWS
jgi:hypothetical protein